MLRGRRRGAYLLVVWLCRVAYPREVVYLSRAGKYKRPAWQPAQEQKGLDVKLSFPVIHTGWHA